MASGSTSDLTMSRKADKLSGWACNMETLGSNPDHGVSRSSMNRRT